jgi:hypothetical protein
MQINSASPSFEVYPTPLANSPICHIPIIEMFAALTSPQLNQVNIATRNNEINSAPPSFEVSLTPLANSPICGTPIIEMFVALTSSQLNQVNIATRNI